MVFPFSFIFRTTIVFPFSLIIFSFEICSIFSIFNSKFDMGLLNKSFIKDNLFTLILLNLLSLSDKFLFKFNNNELPSIKILRFNSKTSENIKSSNTPVKSVSLTMA